MNSRLLLTVVVLAALALLALIGLQRALEEAVREREESQPTEESAPAAASPSAHGDSAAAAGQGRPDETWPVAETQSDCLTYSEVRRHPGLRQEIERVRAAGLLRDDLEVYRSVDEAALEGLADTGDTGAMMVLGQRQLLAGQGRDPRRAVDLLNPGVASREGAGPIDLEVLDRDLLEEAAGWFYRAALHGRVYALTQVGEALSWRGGFLDAPVELGWVDQDPWKTMTITEKSYWRPVYVYAKTVYDVAPSLSTGLGEFGYRLSLQESVETQALRDRIVRRFLEDQQAAGLPPVDIPAADFDLREFVERLCPGVADSLERDGWQ